MSAGRTWVDRVISVLGTLARSDKKLATSLAAAMPADDAGLAASIQALGVVLSSVKAQLPTEAQTDQRLADVAELCAALVSLTGAVHTYGVQLVCRPARVSSAVALRDMPSTNGYAENLPEFLRGGLRVLHLSIDANSRTSSCLGTAEAVFLGKLVKVFTIHLRFTRCGTEIVVLSLQKPGHIVTLKSRIERRSCLSIT